MKQIVQANPGTWHIILILGCLRCFIYFERSINLIESARMFALTKSGFDLKLSSCSADDQIISQASGYLCYPQYTYIDAQNHPPFQDM